MPGLATPLQLFAGAGAKIDPSKHAVVPPALPLPLPKAQGQAAQTALPLASPSFSGPGAPRQQSSTNTPGSGHSSQKTNFAKRTNTSTPHHYKSVPFPVLFDSSVSSKKSKQGLNLTFGDFKDELERMEESAVDRNGENPMPSLVHPTRALPLSSPCTVMECSLPHQILPHIPPMPYSHIQPHRPLSLPTFFPSGHPHPMSFTYLPHLQHRHPPYEHHVNSFANGVPPFLPHDFTLLSPQSPCLADGSQLHSMCCMPPNNTSFQHVPHVPPSPRTAILSPNPPNHPDSRQTFNLQRSISVHSAATDHLSPSTPPPLVPTAFPNPEYQQASLENPHPETTTCCMSSEMGRYVQSQFGRLQFADLVLNVKCFGPLDAPITFQMGFHSLLSGKIGFLSRNAHHTLNRVIDLDVQNIITTHDPEDKPILERLAKYIGEESIKVAIAWAYGFSNMAIQEWLEAFDKEHTHLGIIINNIQRVPGDQEIKPGDDHYRERVAVEDYEHETERKPKEPNRAFSWADEVAEEELLHENATGNDPRTPQISTVAMESRLGGSSSPSGTDKSSISQETSITHPLNTDVHPGVHCGGTVMLQRMFSLLGTAILLELPDLSHFCLQRLKQQVSAWPGVGQGIMLLSEVLNVHSTKKRDLKGYYSKELAKILWQDALPLVLRGLDVMALGRKLADHDKCKSLEQGTEDALRNLLIQLPHPLFRRVAKWNDYSMPSNIGKKYEIIKSAVDERNRTRKENLEQGASGEDSKFREKAWVEFPWATNEFPVPLAFGDVVFPLARARVIVDKEHIGGRKQEEKKGGKDV